MTNGARVSVQDWHPPSETWTVLRRHASYFVATICLLLVSCASVKVTSKRELGAVPTVSPKAIYVDDFVFNPAGMRAERGVLPITVMSDYADESSVIFERIIGVQTNRGVRQRELADLMSSSLVEDLRTVGLTAYRFGPRETLPRGAWLLQGRFVWVDEGNRLERAVIGFGSGATELDVVVSLNEVQEDGPRPFCEVSTMARSRRQAGAIASLDPVAAVARFMVGGLDLDKNVMETGSELATTIAHYVQSHNCAT